MPKEEIEKIVEGVFDKDREKIMHAGTSVEFDNALANALIKVLEGLPKRGHAEDITFVSDIQHTIELIRKKVS